MVLLFFNKKKKRCLIVKLQKGIDLLKKFRSDNTLNLYKEMVQNQQHKDTDTAFKAKAALCRYKYTGALVYVQSFISLDTEIWYYLSWSLKYKAILYCYLSSGLSLILSYVVGKTVCGPFCFECLCGFCLFVFTFLEVVGREGGKKRGQKRYFLTLA